MSFCKNNFFKKSKQHKYFESDLYCFFYYEALYNK